VVSFISLASIILIFIFVFREASAIFHHQKSQTDSAPVEQMETYGEESLGTLNPFEPVRTMSATIGAEMAEVVFGDFHYSVFFFIGALLFAVSFGLNFIAETVVRRLLMKRLK
jgi:ABC-type phosphate transport system permease subunit